MVKLKQGVFNSLGHEEKKWWGLKQSSLQKLLIIACGPT
jgi:hypothetical protein